MAGERSKRVRLRLTLDVDYEPGTEQGFGGLTWFGRHVADLLELSDGDYVDDETGDNFYYTLVDVELADQ